MPSNAARLTAGVISHRQVRAVFDDDTITVYQAYAPEIAEPALRAGRFVAPFSRGRMTWIKPSFLWMAYRCGWSTKPGQERTLAVRITRTGFEHALGASCLSHFEPGTYPDVAAWEERRDATHVRVQWDPERDLHLRPLGHRSLQIGLGPPAVASYVDEWIVGLTDVTAAMHRIGRLVHEGRDDQATPLLPAERPYALPVGIARVIGATPPASSPPE